jgi:organic hydroperoxide reductase OsmC/OhrA
VVFAADPAAPDADAFRELHDTAHHECYIANSVKTEIRVEPTLEVA